MADPGRSGPRRRRAVVRPRPRRSRRTRRADAVARLAARHRAHLQLHGRDLPPVLHRRPRPGDRRPGRDRRRSSCGGTATRWSPPAILGCVTALTAALSYELLARDASWHPWLRYAVLVVGFVGAALIVGVHHLPRRVAAVVAAAALVAGLAGPAAYSVATAATPHSGSIPSAGPSSAGGFGPGAGGPGGGPEVAAPAGGLGGATRGATGRRDRRRQHRRPARRQYVEHRADHAARDRCVVVHLGRRGGRLQQRGRLPARHPGAGDGDRRLQRLRPEPDARAVPARG